MTKLIIGFLVFFFQLTLIAYGKISNKVLICGVCKNIEQAVDNTIRNIEELGNNFSDYKVIIYENNSTDNTAQKIQLWSERNPHVIFKSENLSKNERPLSRTEGIARARNIVLSIADDYMNDYSFLIMVDLDFITPWPIEEILETLNQQREWDCVTANGIRESVYYDRYAFRDQKFPLGPELLGDWWWSNLRKTWFSLEGEEWIPTYSSFGGLGIYKTSSIKGCSYSGIVTDDLKKYYKQILMSLPNSINQIRKYKHLNGGVYAFLYESALIFRKNSWGEHPKNYKPVTCCEHIPFHASMALKGNNRIFVNPKLIMNYE